MGNRRVVPERIGRGVLFALIPIVLTTVLYCAIWNEVLAGFAFAIGGIGIPIAYRIGAKAVRMRGFVAIVLLELLGAALPLAAAAVWIPATLVAELQGVGTVDVLLDPSLGTWFGSDFIRDFREELLGDLVFAAVIGGGCTAIGIAALRAAERERGWNR